MLSKQTIVRLTTNPVTTWWIRNVASRLDPLLFRASGGRLTAFGPPAMPMLTLTTRGRRSGRPRSVHLACLECHGDHLVVASAMGQARHPAWSHNLEADPNVEVQTTGERFAARAERRCASTRPAPRATSASTGCAAPTERFHRAPMPALDVDVDFPPDLTQDQRVAQGLSTTHVTAR